jgi:hypothetical protein
VARLVQAARQHGLAFPEYHLASIFYVPSTQIFLFSLTVAMKRESDTLDCIGEEEEENETPTDDGTAGILGAPIVYLRKHRLRRPRFLTSFDREMTPDELLDLAPTSLDLYKEWLMGQRELNKQEKRGLNRVRRMVLNRHYAAESRQRARDRLASMSAAIKQQGQLLERAVHLEHQLVEAKQQIENLKRENELLLLQQVCAK